MTARISICVAPAALALALVLTGCPARGSDSSVPGTDAAEGSDSAMGTDSAPPASDSGTTATIAVNVTEVQDNPAGPIAGVTVEFFARTDLAEAAPLASGTTDAAGNAFVPVDVAGGPVDHYAKVSSAGGYVDTYHYRNFPITMSKTRSLPITSTATWGLFTSLTPGGGFDPATEAIAAFAIVDCMGMPIMGATVAASSGTVRYQSGGFPVGMTSTDASGEVVIFQVIAGMPATFTVTAPSAPVGCAGGTMTMNVVDIRADRPHLGVILLP